jgi:hypothetical protein
MIRKPISEIIGDLLSTLPNTFKVGMVVLVDANTTTFETCDPLWSYVSTATKVYNSANAFNITDITYSANKYTITLNGTGFNVDNATTLQRPSYFHGTTLATDKELLNNRNGNNKGEKYPILYLYEVLAEFFYTDKSKSALERESDLRLFFLSEANEKVWNTDEHYDNVINPMANLAHLFNVHVDNQAGFHVDDRYKITYHANFGNYRTNGHFEKIFTDVPLSGVELTNKITKRKFKDCLC